MNKFTSVLLSALVLIIMPLFTGNTTLSAQSWTSVDGGGTYGISSTTSTNSNFPSVAVLNGEMYAIWQEWTGSAYELHVKKYNGSAWTTAGNSAGSSLLYSSTYSLMYPKLVYYNNALYAAWSGFDAGIYVVHVKKYNGSTWTYTQDYIVGEGRSNINNGITANAMKIDIAVYNGQLYAIWVEQDHLGGGFYNVRISKYDGITWSSIDGNGSYGINKNTMVNASYPTLCVYNNMLYAAWTESNSSSISQLRVRRYDGSSVWTFVDGNGDDGLNYSPTTPIYDVPFSLSSYSGKMYAFWTENNRLRVKRYDETNGWTTDIDGGNGWNHNSAVGAYYPNAITYNNLLYASWEQNPVPRQVRVASFDGTTKTFIDGNVAAFGINNTTTNRGHFPKLVAYKGDLMAVWSEELTSTSGSANQIRAKKCPLPPFVETVSVPTSGTYMSGQTLNFTVTFSKDVVVSGGTPYIPITLNTGGTVNATYTSGTGTSTLIFSYTIATGNGDTDGISLGTAISIGGATLQSEDAIPITANLTLNSVGSTTGILVDAVGPTVTSVSSTNIDGYYNAGDVIAITITCSEAATVTGTPTLSLNSGGTASYASGSGTTVLTFSYTVASGQNIADLDYAATSALSLSGGTIKDGTGNDAVLTLPTVGVASSLGGQKDIVIDNTAPTASISSTATDPTNASTFIITVTFSESVTGFVVGDISVTNGTAGSFTTVNAFTYTANITPNAAGTATVNVAGSVATDAAGNNNTAATALTRVYDNVAPTIALSSTATNPTNTSSLPVTITFSESVTGFLVGDITVTNGTAGSFSTVNAYTYTASITPIASGTVTIDIAGSVATDAAGNNNTAATALTRVYDNIAPTVTISSSATDPTNAASIPVTITFNESVTGFDAEDIIITNGTKGILSGSGAIYNISITPLGQGVVTVNVAAGIATDAAGNVNALATQLSRTYDNIVPSVSVSSTFPDPTNSNPISVSIVFSEAITGFEVSDITVDNATASNLQTSDNITWTADISANSTAGFRVEIFAGVAQDLAGNDNTASAYLQRTYDPNAPTVTLSSASPDPTNHNPIVVNIALSESSWDLLDISKIIVGNGTAANLKLLAIGYHENWTVDIYPTADGLVTVDIPAGVVKDYAGNDNIAATQFSRTCDITSPTVALSSTASEFTNTSSIPVTVTFNEPVTGFVAGDITVTNGTAGNFSGSGTTYTADIAPSGQGVVTINVATGVAQDAVGNNNIAATQLSRTFDNIVPTVLSVSSSTDDGAYKTGDAIAITITFSEIVVVTGTPTLELNSGGTASYGSGSGSSVLTFSYTVASGNRSNDLDYLTTNSLSLSGGTIEDQTGNAATLTLPEVGSSNSIGGQKNIIIGTASSVTTQAVTDIVSTTATGNGNITDLGNPNPIAYGVCWNTTGAPTISDSKADNGAISSTGSFTASMTGLASGTTFYVRAYVTNIVSTSYGDEVSFTTNGIITYNLNGGINHAANTDSYIYGVGLTLSEPIRSGYIFGGWYGNETFTGSAITAISSTTKGDVTLYARWNPATGVNNITSTGITLYPNPARDVVFIKGVKGLVNIYDTNSHLILTKQIDDSSSIDISSLAHGVYFVIINNKNYKLIKE